MAVDRKILMDACPKCGQHPIVLVDLPGRDPFAACEDRACKTYLGLDAEQRPVLLAEPCSACGRATVTTGKFGPVCMACGARGGVRNEAERPGAGCPKCKVGLLRIRPSQFGGHWAACGNQECDCKFDCDAEGKPLGGACRHCGGPVKRLKDGRKGPCAACGKWQDAAPARTETADRPPDARCPYCSGPLKPVRTRKGDWVYRCDPCEKWIPVEDSGSR